VQTAGLSLLAPALTVYDGRGRVVGRAESADPSGSTVSVRIDRYSPNATYYARVEGATDDVFGIGRYALVTTFDARVKTGAAALEAFLREAPAALRPDEIDNALRNPAAATFNDDRHTDDTLGRAQTLQTAAGFAPQSRYDVLASLGDATDVDVYRIRSLRFPGDRPGFMTVSVVSSAVNGLAPRVSVFDEDGRAVAAEVLASGGGTFAVQVSDVRPDRRYYVRVFAAPDAADRVGNYALAVRFDTEGAPLRTFAAGTFDAAAPDRAYQLFAAQGQLFQFTLSAGPAPAGAAVRMTVTDGRGNVAASLVARAGEAASVSGLFLAPGAYSVRFTVEWAGAGPAPALTYRLRGAGLGDLIGPALSNPTLAPQPTTSPVPAQFSYPGGLTSPDPYVWVYLDPGGYLLVPTGTDAGSPVSTVPQYSYGYLVGPDGLPILTTSPPPSP
jgi:hypothetical protein